MKTKIAYLTPTWERARFLENIVFCMASQEFTEPVEARWFVMDDSQQPNTALQALHGQQIGLVTVDYRWLPQKNPLGWKRGRLNDLAVKWGAQFICSVDDDDWYGPAYGQRMMEVIRESPAGLAGSSEDFYLNLENGRLLRFPPCGPWHSCHGVLCYNRLVARKSQYLAHRNEREEPAFINNRPVAQLPDIYRYHLGLIHPTNTVNKSDFGRDPANVANLTLDDLPMTAESRAFYAALLAEHGVTTSV